MTIPNWNARLTTLTALANRKLLRDRLEQVFASVNRYDGPAWGRFINPDRFKFVDDMLGHRVDDLLLQCIAQRFDA